MVILDGTTRGRGDACLEEQSCGDERFKFLRNAQMIFGWCWGLEVEVEVERKDMAGITTGKR